MMLRRRPLLAGLAGLASGLTGRAAAAALPDLRQIAAAGPGLLAALTAGGELWTLPARATTGRRLGDGLDPATPPAAAYGRIAARRRDGALWVHEAGRITTSPPSRLAAEAGLLVLPAGIIGIAATAGGSHRVVRFDPTGAGWGLVATSAQDVLPDARPLQADLDGSGDGGHLVLLGGPDGERYRHGVLGDEFEATRVLLLERHGLTPMRELAIEAPWVIEDIAPRRVALDGRDGLLSVLSGPQGAQLALLDADPARARALRVAARGEALGTPRRWMAPVTDGRHWLAVHTPHLAGTLHAYRRDGDRLLGRAVDDDAANHRLGSRRLDTSAWLGERLLLPGRSGRRLHWLDAAAGWRRLGTVELPARVADLVALPGAGCVAALLEDGGLRWIEAPA
jgi:hypothetical protein